jgi:hypothetical protein
MGFFKKKEKEQEEEENPKEELIADANKLFATYRSLKDKIQDTLDESGHMVIPIIDRLLPNREADDEGDFNKLRDLVTSSRIKMMTVGIRTNKMINDSEQVIMWMTRYSKKLEKYIFEGFDIICRSSFAIIQSLYEKIAEQKKEIAYLNAKIDSYIDLDSQAEKKEVTHDITDEEPLTTEEKNEVKKWIEKKLKLARRQSAERPEKEFKQCIIHSGIYLIAKEPKKLRKRAMLDEAIHTAIEERDKEDSEKEGKEDIYSPLPEGNR